MTFLDKVEQLFEELKAELIHNFGDHMHIHNAVADAKVKAITAAAEHFGEEEPEQVVTAGDANSSLNSSTENDDPAA